MRLRASILLFCLALASLAAPVLAHADSWSQVVLFDWVYPGEDAYETLKAAAAQAGGAGWLSQRFEANEKIPQASARELASRIWDDGRLDAPTQAKLKKLFADEPQQMDALDQDAKRMAGVSSALDRSSQKLDELEASLDKNRYGKGSTPSVNMDLYSGYRLLDPSGLTEGQGHGYQFGGMNLTLLGTVDKMNFTVTLGARYWYSADATPDPYSSLEMPLDAGASFQMPLGNGGLEVHLGDVVNVEMSPLLLANIFPPNRDSFFVDVSQAYRGPTLIKPLDLGYPASTLGERGFYVRRQGSTWYWPFNLTQLLYAPDNQLYESFDAHFNVLSARVEEDLGGHWDWLDGGTLYYVNQSAGTDEDQMREEAFAPQLPLGSRSQGLGLSLRLASGTQLSFDGASSHSVDTVQAAGASTTTVQVLDDTAWIANLIQQIGPLSIAVEAGAAGGEYESSGHTILPGNHPQVGAVLDSIADQTQVFVPAAVTNVAWISFIKDPNILSNNTQRLALKTQWHGSWVSLGLADGVIPQENASGPVVETTPYLEGHAFNGFGWFDMFGTSFAPPPAPFTAGTGAVAAQGAFNLPTDGNAIYDQAGHTEQVHWQQISQLDFRETQYTLLLTQNGVGDPHLMQDSVKTLNYASGTLNFDIASLLSRTLPFELDVIGEFRDLADMPGVPALTGSHFFSQQIGVAFLTYAMTPSVNFLGMGGYETWRSEHSYYPVNMQVREVGTGFDWKLDPIVTGLQFNFRVTQMNFDDLNIASRELSLLTLNVGSTLSY
jgi:hypothetical protein